MMKTLFAVVLWAFAAACATETSLPPIEPDSDDAGAAQGEPEKAIEIINPASVNKGGGGGGRSGSSGGASSQPTGG